LIKYLNRIEKINRRKIELNKTRYGEGTYKCPECDYKRVVDKGCHLNMENRHCPRCNKELKLIEEK